MAEAESMTADVVQEVEAGHLAKDVAEASDKTVAQDRALLLEAKEDAAESAKKAEHSSFSFDQHLDEVESWPRAVSVTVKASLVR